MLCTYSYSMKKDNKIFEDFQADTEDFKKLFKKLYKEMQNCVVITEEKIYIWTPPTENKCSGWQIISRKKLKKQEEQKKLPAPEQITIDI